MPIKLPSMAKTFIVRYATVDVYEDIYDEGEGAYVNGWNMSIKGNAYKSLTDIIKAVSIEDPIFSDDKQNWVYMDGRLLTDAEVNADNEEPDDDEYEQWGNGDLMLYVARLDIGIDVYDEAYELTEEEAEEEAEAEGFQIY